MRHLTLSITPEVSNFVTDAHAKHAKKEKGNGEQWAKDEDEKKEHGMDRKTRRFLLLF